MTKYLPIVVTLAIGLAGVINEARSLESCRGASPCRAATLESRVQDLESKTEYFEREVFKKTIVIRPGSNPQAESSCSHINALIFRSGAAANEMKIWIKYNIVYSLGANQIGLSAIIWNKQSREIDCIKQRRPITGSGTWETNDAFCSMTVGAGQSLTLDINQYGGPSKVCLTQVVREITAEISANRLTMRKPE